MKKMLMLVLVLGMAGAVNALPLFTAVATAPFEITITFTDPTPDNALDLYIDWGPLGIDPNIATLTGSGASIANLFVWTVAVDGYDVYALSLGNLTDWANPTELAVLDLNGAGANVGSTPVTLGIMDGNGGDAGTVTVMIPEPATMVLLSLGGLLLRRKK